MRPSKNTPPPIERKDADAVLEALVAMLAPRVAAELAKLHDAGAEYSSLELPPRTTRRVFRETCASGRVDGATKDGKAWRCSREAWFAGRRREPIAPLRVVGNPAPRVVTSEDELAAQDLEAAGLRPTRRRAG